MSNGFQKKSAEALVEIGTQVLAILGDGVSNPYGVSEALKTALSTADTALETAITASVAAKAAERAATQTKAEKRLSTAEALSAIAVDAVAGLAAALAIGRASVVALSWITPPAGSASAAQFNATLTSGVALATVLQGVAIAFLPGPLTASFLLGGSTALTLIARSYFVRRIGGVNGDCLGTTEQAVETWCLVVYTCRSCTL